MIRSSLARKRDCDCGRAMARAYDIMGIPHGALRADCANEREQTALLGRLCVPCF